MAERDIGYKRKMAVSVFTGLIVQSFQMWYQYSSKKDDRYQSTKAGNLSEPNL